MPIPDDVRENAENAMREFCERHSAERTTDSILYTYKVETNALTLIEQRPSFVNPSEMTSKPVARFRYSESKSMWSLYWGDPSGKWQRVTGSKPAADIRTLLQAVIDDPLGVFWS